MMFPMEHEFDCPLFPKHERFGQQAQSILHLPLAATPVSRQDRA